MANDNNNMNELAGDEDPTSELEAITCQHGDADDVADESDAHTMDFANLGKARSGLTANSDKYKSLQYELEQSRALQAGLEAELRSREQITKDLGEQLELTRLELTSKIDALKERNSTVRELKREIRERNSEYSDINTTLQKTRNELASLEEIYDSLMQESSDQTSSISALETTLNSRDTEILDLRETLNGFQAVGSSDPDENRRLEALLASRERELGDLNQKLRQSETYADELRTKLQDSMQANRSLEESETAIHRNLHDAVDEMDCLKSEIAEKSTQINALTADLEGIEAKHEEEIRVIRFELSQAEDTISHGALINEQLASDLVDTRNFKENLEQMLTNSEENAQAEIVRLERQLEKSKRQILDQSRDIESKNDAINTLLSELAAKQSKTESTDEHVVLESDDILSDEPSEPQSSQDHDRVRRFLIGEVDGQEVRFPLFKERLTIGRTQANDLQLNADYISRRHAVIVTEQDTTRVVDWGSRNGVFVNTRRVTEHFLKSGDKVTIGTFDFMYEEKPRR